MHSASAATDGGAAANWRMDAPLSGRNANVVADVRGGANSSSEWAVFMEALNATEREALSLILQGGADIKAFADKNGLMLEVLADGINEKAADIIGDSILETGEGITIYEEYRSRVRG